MSQRLEFFFDYRSPYSYLAHSQLGNLDAEVAYRPFEIPSDVGLAEGAVLGEDRDLLARDVTDESTARSRRPGRSGARSGTCTC